MLRRLRNRSGFIHYRFDVLRNDWRLLINRFNGFRSFYVFFATIFKYRVNNLLALLIVVLSPRK